MSMETLEGLCLELNRNGGDGFLLKVPDEIYRQHPAISQSELKTFAKFSPAHYREYRLNPPEQSDPLKLGLVAHHAILEPEKFNSLYVRGPQVDLRTKKGKEDWERAKVDAEESGKDLLRPEIFDPPYQMIQKLWGSKFYGNFLKGGFAERSMFARIQGIPCKGRMDYWKPHEHEIVDLKTTESAGKQAFERDIRTYRYHWQAAFYIDLVTALTDIEPTFKILAIEKKPPYAMAVHEIGFDLIAIARREILENLQKLHDCLLRDFWPAYPEEVNLVRATDYEWKIYKGTAL